MINSTLLRSPIAIGAFAKNRTRILVLLTAICLIATATISFANSSTGDDYIKFSTKSDRSNPTALNGATVKGDIYVFLGDTENDAFTYYINGVKHKGMRSYPQDMEYLSSDRKTPNAFDTTNLDDGPNTITVSVWNSKDRTVTKHVSNFNVDNTPDQVNDYIKFSTSSDRSNPQALDGKTVSGNIYIFLGDTTIDAAHYKLEGVSDKRMSSAPQDFQYREKDGTAKPFDTNKLEDGEHTIKVTTGEKTNGRWGNYKSHSSTFTINNAAVTQPTVPPTTVTPTVPPTTKPTAWSPTFAGDVKPGTIYWGAGIRGNGDPVARHESDAGVPLGIRRTFFGWRHIESGYLINTAREDLEAGRLPWVSIKPPQKTRPAPGFEHHGGVCDYGNSWEEVANGVYDDGLRKLLTQLDNLQGPVWFTINHEPEGGGKDKKCPELLNRYSSDGHRIVTDDPSNGPGFVAMNKQVRKILDELDTDNIAFAPIMMGWSHDPYAYNNDPNHWRHPDKWFEPGIWDFYGIDEYNESRNTVHTNSGWKSARNFAESKGLTISVGEWGQRGEDAAAAQRMRDFYNHALNSHKDGKGARIVGLAAFDSNLNSPKGGWELKGEPLKEFRTIMNLSTSVRLK